MPSSMLPEWCPNKAFLHSRWPQTRFLESVTSCKHAIGEKVVYFRLATPAIYSQDVALTDRHPLRLMSRGFSSKHIVKRLFEVVKKMESRRRWFGRTITSAYVKHEQVAWKNYSCARTKTSRSLSKENNASCL